MLDNILSNKLFFVQILIMLGASLLGILLINPQEIPDRYVLGIGTFVLNWYMIARYCREDESLKENSYTIWFFSVWMISFVPFYFDYRLGITFLLMNYVMIHCFGFENEKNDPKNAFDIGFFYAISCMFLPQLILFFPLLFVYFLSLYAINKNIGWIFLIGFILPILGLVQIAYLLDFDFLLPHFTQQIMLKGVAWRYEYLLLLPVVVVLILAFIDHFIHENKQAANRKRMYILLLAFMIISLIIFGLYSGTETYFLAFLAMPISVMMAKYVKHRKPEHTTYRNVLLIGFLVCMLFFAFIDKMPKIYTLFREVTV